MYVLDQSEIRKIENRVTLAEVQNGSLSIDLVDHICCMIEDRIERGMNLNKAEEEVFKEMGEVQLKAIDLETKLLTQNKFIMKKRTKIIGLVALILVVTGFTFKMLHLQGAGIIWGTGVLTLAFGFFLFVLVDRFSYEKSSNMRVTGVVGYLGSALLIVGLGMNLLNWPYSVYLAEAGSLLLLTYFILTNVMSKSVEEAK
jgi:hypothetical protein